MEDRSAKIQKNTKEEKEGFEAMKINFPELKIKDFILKMYIKVLKKRNKVCNWKHYRKFKNIKDEQKIPKYFTK